MDGKEKKIREIQIDKEVKLPKGAKPLNPDDFVLEDPGDAAALLDYINRKHDRKKGLGFKKLFKKE